MTHSVTWSVTGWIVLGRGYDKRNDMGHDRRVDMGMTEEMTRGIA